MTADDSTSSTSSETPVETTSTTPPAEGGDENRAGGEKAVLADLARERKERQALAKKIEELEPLAAKARELEESRKTETEKLTEKLTASEQRALDAMRFEVALDKGLTKSQAKRLVGTTMEELTADADVLLEDLGQTDPPAAKVSGRPRENLRAGNDPEVTPEEKDLKKIGERMFAR